MHQERMLPRKFPKFSSFLVNASPKFGRIELNIKMGEPRFGYRQNVFALNNTLVRGLGWIIPSDGLIANPFFGNQLERRLKGIDVRP